MRLSSQAFADARVGDAREKQRETTQDEDCVEHSDHPSCSIRAAQDRTARMGIRGTMEARSIGIPYGSAGGTTCGRVSLLFLYFSPRRSRSNAHALAARFLA
jgi:hypothetical protein